MNRHTPPASALLALGTPHVWGGTLSPVVHHHCCCALLVISFALWWRPRASTILRPVLRPRASPPQLQQLPLFTGYGTEASTISTLLEVDTNQQSPMWRRMSEQGMYYRCSLLSLDATERSSATLLLYSNAHIYLVGYTIPRGRLRVNSSQLVAVRHARNTTKHQHECANSSSTP